MTAGSRDQGIGDEAEDGGYPSTGCAGPPPLGRGGWDGRRRPMVWPPYGDGRRRARGYAPLHGREAAGRGLAALRGIGGDRT